MISGIRKNTTNINVIMQKASVSFKKYGITHIIKIGLSTLIRPLLQHEYFKLFVKELKGDGFNAAGDNKGIRLCIFSNLKQFQQNMKGQLSKMNPYALAESRFKKGHLCAVAEDQNGQQLFSLWFLYGPQRLNVDFLIKDNEAYFYNAYTLPQKRGRGIYPEVLRLLSLYLYAQGIKKLYCIILPAWHASIKGVAKAGFSYLRDLRYIKLFMSDRLTFKMSNNYRSFELRKRHD